MKTTVLGGRRAMCRAASLLFALALASGSLPVAAQSATKSLYLFDDATADPNGFNQGALPYLSRTPPLGAQASISLNKNQPPVTWAMTPAIAAPFTLDAGVIPVTIIQSKGGNSPPPDTRQLVVSLSTIGAVTGPLGSPTTVNFVAAQSGSPAAITANIPLPAVTVLPAGTQIQLTIENTSTGNGSRIVRLFPAFNGQNSQIDLPALTYINVDTVAALDAPFPGGIQPASFAPGSQISLRADVSDPFGVFDIGSVTIDIDDANGAPVVTAASMTQVATLSGATATYEYLYTLPAGGAPGDWTYVVTASEGTEGTVTDSLGGIFTVRAALLITKSVSTLSDPVNGGTNPKAIPGATMLYMVTVGNAGVTALDGDSLVIVDPLPTQAALFVDTSAGDPIVFVEGTPASGLNYDYATDVEFSSQPGGGPPYTYAPNPDIDGFDTAVTGIRISPDGAMAGDSGSGAPEFELRYRMRID